jgi:hypothetical protein
MLLVVADTGPIRYLVEIGHVGICLNCSRKY